MANDNSKIVLQTYIDKALKLKQFKFESHVQETGFDFHIDENWATHFSLVNEEKRDAFLLTFRMFFQENEPISFPRLKVILEDSEISENFRKRVTEIRNEYFDYLKGHPQDIKPGFFQEGANPTRKDILKVVLYGDLAHTNEQQKFRLWARDEIRKGVLLQVFTRTVTYILSLIYAVCELSETELSKN